MGWGCGVRGGRGGSYLQNAYGLEASEGSLCDVADGVVPQTERVEIPEHSQTAFVQTSQVVVRQIPGGRDGGRGGHRRGREGDMFCVRSGRRRQVGTTLRQLATS